MLNYGAYEHWIQSRLVQAQYWHDPLVKIIECFNLNNLFPFKAIELYYRFNQLVLFDLQDEDTYEKYSLFLSDINNAKKVKNET